MRCLVVFFMAGLLSTGCATSTIRPSPATDDTGRATQADTALPNTLGSSPSTVQTPEVVNHADLAPYFQVIDTSVEGVFLILGENLYYVKDGFKVHVLKGSQPRALASGSDGVLVSNGVTLFWFDPATGELREVDNAPPAQRVAVQGNAYVMAVNKQVVHWVPPASPVVLPAPDHLFAVYGVSISPDGRYGVAAYDLDIPNGPRAGVIWAYDLQTGTILKWPSVQPTFMYGLWLLGWSEPNSVRFMTGVRGSNVGHTWQLPGGNPEESDGTKYTVIDGGASTSPDGSWVIYRSSIGEIDLQSVRPGSKAIIVYKDASGVDDPRILLNGHLAFRTRQPAAWWEITRDGTVVRWDQADALN